MNCHSFICIHYEKFSDFKKITSKQLSNELFIRSEYVACVHVSLSAHFIILCAGTYKTDFKNYMRKVTDELRFIVKSFRWEGVVCAHASQLRIVTNFNPEIQIFVLSSKTEHLQHLPTPLSYGEFLLCYKWG